MSYELGTVHWPPTPKIYARPLPLPPLPPTPRLCLGPCGVLNMLIPNAKAPEAYAIPTTSYTVSIVARGKISNDLN